MLVKSQFSFQIPSFAIWTHISWNPGSLLAASQHVPVESTCPISGRKNIGYFFLSLLIFALFAGFTWFYLACLNQSSHSGMLLVASGFPSRKHWSMCCSWWGLTESCLCQDRRVMEQGCKGRMGLPFNRWTVYFMENPIHKGLICGYSYLLPVTGTPHMRLPLENAYVVKYN